MKHIKRRGLIVGMVIALAGAAFGFIFWVVATTNGTRWILKTAPALAGAKVSAQHIDGRLIDHLLLSKVKLSTAHQKVEVDLLELRWQPLLLMTGTLAVQELTVKGMQIQNDAPADNKPLNLEWPRKLSFASFFDYRIKRLRLADVSYRGQQGQPVEVASLAAAVTLQDGLLSINNFAMAAPEGRINGSVRAGFKHPSLWVNLAIRPSRPIADMNLFTLLMQNGKVKGMEQIAERISIAGTAGKQKLLDFTGVVGMTSTGFNLHQLSLTRPNRPGIASAEGSLTFKEAGPNLSLQAKIAGLDLAQDSNIPTNISGNLKLSGTLDTYQGDITLANQVQGWQAGTVSATYRGTRENLKLTSLNGRAVGGSIAGYLDIDWSRGLSLRGEIRGRDLNPAEFAPGWQGMANFNADWSLGWSADTPMSGRVHATLLESRLHGQKLTGELQADFADHDLILSKLALQGKGLNLQASGAMKKRLNMTAKISDLSRVVPDASGALQAEGWMRYLDHHLIGAITGKGNKLAYHGAQIAEADLRAGNDQGTGSPQQVTASLQDVRYNNFRFKTVTLNAKGTLPRHSVKISLGSATGKVQLSLDAGYTGGIWQGEINHLFGTGKTGVWNLAAPSSFTISHKNLSLSPLTITSDTSERLEAAVDLTLNPLIGQVRTAWTDLDLSKANAYLENGHISGSSNGFLTMGLSSPNQLTLTGKATARGKFTEKDHSITLKQGKITLDGGKQGLRVAIALATGDGGGLTGSFSSTAPLGQAIPEQGEIRAEINGISLLLFKPWLPPGTSLDGHISGRLKGSLLAKHTFELDGKAHLSGGILHWNGPEGEQTLNFKSAKASLGWRGETMTGTLSLAMAEHGHLQTDLQLPLAARFPFSVNPQGPLTGSFSGKFMEKGLVSALFPELVQESSAAIDTNLAVKGTWAEPLITGKLRLDKSSAYLPFAGIHLRNLQILARLENHLIKIESIHAESGPGSLTGTALITLAGRQVAGYQGTIEGENFQTVDFPELHLLSTPKFTFEGTPEKLKLHGTLLLPELSFVQTPSSKVITPSNDVILEGKNQPAETTQPLALDIQVGLRLGKKVFVKVAGIDAQLGGAMDLSMSGLSNVTSTGEIRVIKGRYRSFGVNLDIARGRLFFVGNRLDRPTLDFLALRTIGDVKAGVTVTGTLQKPLTKLYSEPTMQDADTLAYIVLGHPLGGSEQKTTLLTQAADALLTSGEAMAVQEQVKNRLGLSTLEIQGGVGDTKSYGDFTPLQTAPPGEIGTTQQPGITKTVLTIGKFLTPELYISYGRSLFTGGNLFQVRYDISKKWQIETQTGSNESGADLYYKMEFK